MNTIEERCRTELDKHTDFTVGFQGYNALHSLHSDTLGVYQEDNGYRALGTAFLGELTALFAFLTYRKHQIIASTLSVACGIICVVSLYYCLVPKPRRRIYLIKNEKIIISDEDHVDLAAAKRFIFCTIPPGVPMLGGYEDVCTHYAAFVECENILLKSFT